MLAWVRTLTAWIPYDDSLQDPRGVLLDRRGNSLDRRLLQARAAGEVGGTGAGRVAADAAAASDLAHSTHAKDDCR